MQEHLLLKKLNSISPPAFPTEMAQPVDSAGIPIAGASSPYLQMENDIIRTDFFRKFIPSSMITPYWPVLISTLVHGIWISVTRVVRIRLNTILKTPVIHRCLQLIMCKQLFMQENFCSYRIL